MTQPKFIPKPGQTDYTDIRYAPALNIVVTHGNKILLAKRSPDRRLYPDYWGTIDGFLDDHMSIEDKVLEELREELDLGASHITDLKRGQVILLEDPDYDKTWLIVPVLAVIDIEDFKLDWEATEARWFQPTETVKLKHLPEMVNVIGQFFPEVREK